jgi:hypothetical protein
MKLFKFVEGSQIPFYKIGFFESEYGPLIPGWALWYPPERYINIYI